jgi:Mn-dependent DtxR family transcriptional regulator
MAESDDANRLIEAVDVKLEGPMISLTDSEHQMFMVIYQLSQGDWRTIINRKQVISAMGVSKSEGENVLRSLTKHGLIQYQLFASLRITQAGLAQAALRNMPRNPTRP